MYSHSKMEKFVGTGLLMGIIILLQLFASGLRIGPVPISLVLIPIVVGAVLYGPAIGAFLGGVFGLIVIIMIVVGMDPASMAMMQFNAVGTVITCMVKGILAGLVSGLVYKMFAKTKNKKTGYVLASACAPIMNTGFYVLMVITIFKGLMEDTSKIQGIGAVFATIMAMIATNFIAEVATTTIIAPIVIVAVKKAMGARKVG